MALPRHAACGAAWTLVLALAPCPVARAQDGALPIPPFREPRFEEDWTVLAPFESRIAPDPWLSWKHAPLAPHRHSWLSVGGQLRARGELREEAGLGTTPTGIVNEDAYLGRARLHADLVLLEGFRLFAEGRVAAITGRDTLAADRPVDDDDPDLLNAFVESRSRVAEELWGAVRFGRQQLELGDGWLVSSDDWLNAPVTFDGLRVLLDAPGFDGSLFLVTEPLRDPDGIDEVDDQTAFFGAHAEWYDEAVRVRAYGYGRHRDSASVAGESGEERRATVGLGATIPFFLGTRASAEGALQFGTLGTADVRAFAYRLGLERSFDVLGGLRLAAGVDYASGDDAGGDGRVGTFDRLYRGSHAFHGVADAVGGQNLIDFSLSAELSLGGETSVELAYHRFARADKADLVYDALGAPTTFGTGGARRIADEVDLVARTRFAPFWTLELGGAIVLADDFLAERSSGDDGLFLFAQAAFTF